MKALIGLLLLVFGHCVSSVLHSMRIFYTASSGLSTFPEFVGVGMVDGVQFNYYDSNTQRVVLKQDWMERYTRDNPDYLERNTRIRKGSQQCFKVKIGIFKQCFNQTGGAHMVQWMYGCEWDDDDDSTDGYDQYGYDGEDFISFDLEHLTWVAPVNQAVTTKQRWDGLRARNEQNKYYYTNECVGWLKKYLAYGKSTLQRTENKSSQSLWTDVPLPQVTRGPFDTEPLQNTPLHYPTYKYYYTEYCYTEYCYTEYCYTEYYNTEYCYTEYCYTEYYYTEYCYTEHCYTEYCYTEYYYTEYYYTEYCNTDYYYYTEYCYRVLLH
ncbi:unnamed protein product [Boreogadus saida]